MSAVPAPDAAALLRTAAKLIRERANAATYTHSERWHTTKSVTTRTPLISDGLDHVGLEGLCIETYATNYEQVNDYIASWDPTVARAVADWLDTTAAWINSSPRCEMALRAIAVAEAYNRDVVPRGEA